MKKQLKDNKGMLTLEACIVVPIFIFMMLALYGVMLMFMGNQLVNHALVQSAKSLSYDPYATQVKSTSAPNFDAMIQSIFSDLDPTDSKYISNDEWYKNPSDVAEVAEERFYAYLKQNDVDALLDYFGVTDVDFSESKVDDGVLHVVMKYKHKMPFNTAGIADRDIKLQLKVRLFQKQ